MTPAVIEVRAVSRTFGMLRAVDDISLEVGDGETGRDHRHQWLRQDNPAQPNHRLSAADKRDDPVSGR